MNENLKQFSGVADVYDAHRPSPPTELVKILNLLAQTERPRCVVDLGSGTGLSTRFWAEHADEVIGVEPNDDMRHQAEAVTHAPNPLQHASAARLPPEKQAAQRASVRYVAATAQATGLPDGCADIVTCSQALHWMEPAPTLAEVARLLRAGGVFAAYDYDWPPFVGWEAEAAYHNLMARMIDINVRHQRPPPVQWAKEEHLSRMKASGHFRYVSEALLHQQDRGNAERMIGLALTGGGMRQMRQLGISEAETVMGDYRREVMQLLGSELRPWYWFYRVRIGVK